MEVVFVGITHGEPWGREGDWVGVLGPPVAVQEEREQCPPELTDKTLWVKLGFCRYVGRTVCGIWEWGCSQPHRQWAAAGKSR